jgi:hypothetical protein
MLDFLGAPLALNPDFFGADFFGAAFFAGLAFFARTDFDFFDFGFDANVFLDFGAVLLPAVLFLKAVLFDFPEFFRVFFLIAMGAV